METRWRIIFKTANGHEVDHDHSTKSLQSSWSLITLTLPLHFLQTVEFLATFDVQIDKTFELFWEK